MTKILFIVIIGGILLSWGLLQVDFISNTFNMLLATINIQIIAAFGQVYLKFVSYNYLMLLLAVFLVLWILNKFIDWIKGN